MSKAVIIFTLFILCISTLNAQSFEMWKKGIEEDFEDQLLVVENREVIFEFHLNKEKEPEIRIYTKLQFESLKSNNFRDTYVIFHDDNSVLEGIVVDGKRRNSVRLSSYDYNGAGIFHSDSKVSTVDLSYYKSGERKQLEYHLIENDLKYLGQKYFHSKYPTKKTTITVKIPDWFQLNIKEVNFDKSKVNVLKSSDKNWTSIITYTAENLEPMFNDDHSKGPTYDYPHLLFLPKSVTLNGQKEILFEGLDDLYGWYKTLVNDVDNDIEPLKPLVEKLTKDLSDDDEKIKAIYYWVQDNIRYIAFVDGIAGFKPESCDNVLNNKYGDCKGMANLTSEMLKIAGFDARLTWLGTRRIAYTYDYPSLATDNHMICSVVKDGEIYFLDPTEKFTSLKEHATRIQGQEVLIQAGDGYLRKVIPENDHTKNLINYEMSLSLDGNSLIGNVNYQCAGESKTEYLNTINNVEKDDFERELKMVLSSFEKDNVIGNVQQNNIENRDKPIDLDYEITINNAVTDIENELYIELDPYKDYVQSEIEEDRKLSYSLNYRRLERSTIKFKIPDGFKVSYLPEMLDLKNDEFNINIKYEKEGDNILYSKMIEFPSYEISKSNFKDWNQSIKALRRQYKEQIVLVKQ